MVLKAQVEKKTAKKSRKAQKQSRAAGTRQQDLEERRKTITAEIEASEARIAEIDETFAGSEFYDRSGPEEIRRLQAERSAVETGIQGLETEWEAIEEELAGGG